MEDEEGKLKADVPLKKFLTEHTGNMKKAERKPTTFQEELDKKRRRKIAALKMETSPSRPKPTRTQSVFPPKRRPKPGYDSYPGYDHPEYIIQEIPTTITAGKDLGTGQPPHQERTTPSGIKKTTKAKN